MDQGLDQTTLGLSETFSIGRVDSDVAQSRCAVVLDVNIRRREKLDEDGNGTGIDELLSVIVWVVESVLQPPPLSRDEKLLTRMCHIEQRARRITLHAHILRICQAD